MKPLLSIVIPAYRAGRTLPRVLHALREQAGTNVEVIVVESTGNNAAAELAAAHPWLRVIRLGNRALPGHARNLGAVAAQADRVVFLDADAVPRSGWIEAMSRCASDGSSAVAGPVGNGTPRSAIGTASYLLEFSEVMPRRRGLPSHGTSANLLLARTTLLEAGGFPENLWPGEDTVLTVPLARRGTLGFEPTAEVVHLNRTTLLALLAHQFRLGQSFADVCDRVPVPYARISHWPLLLAAPGLRLLALLARLVRQRPAAAARALAISPVLALGLVAWGAGLAWARTCPSRSGPLAADD